MKFSTGAFAAATALPLLSGCVSVMPPGSGPAVIESLTVHNAKSRGGTSRTYRIARSVEADLGRRQYVDRFRFEGMTLPAALRGQTFIRTAFGDRGTAPGTSDFLSFRVPQSSIVYVGHDTRIRPKPDWLRTNFMDTGTQARIGSATLELYSNVYPSRATVTLGSNIPTGGNDRNSMYSVIVVPTVVGSKPPTAPSSARITCSTAAVVGLQWKPAADSTRIAGYRILRDSTVVGTTANTYFSDTSVSESTSYTYAISAFDSAGNTADSNPLQTLTAPASSDGDAPYCPSNVIVSMTWDWANGWTQANGSDLWSATWGSDGNVYAFFGDGGGFGGDNDRGRTSFGISMITGVPPPTSATVRNLYGGYNTEHPALLRGKASSIIAAGPDFYAIAGIYRRADLQSEYPHQPSGSPNHLEIAYSIGNAYSWQDSGWSFCGARSGRHAPTGTFCPQGFVNYGAGNAGAMDRYIYLYGMDAASYWGDGPSTPPSQTYLARVPNNKMATQSAYEYFTGMDSGGAPIWSSRTEQMQPVFSDRNADQAGCGRVCPMGAPIEEAVYVPALKRYIAVAQGNYAAQSSFYESPNPWGPWAVISYNNINATSGAGGWANLGIAAGESLGVHFVNAWTSPTGQTLWATYSSTGTAPAGALFPPGGTAMDSFNLLRVDLDLAAVD
jgi:hypothetical protein